MSPVIQPLQLLLMIFAGWLNRRQIDLIAYLEEENRILKERVGGQRINSRRLRPTLRSTPRVHAIAHGVRWYPAPRTVPERQSLYSRCATSE